MKTSVGELFIELGIIGDDEGGKKVAKALDEAIEKAQKAQKQLQKHGKETDRVEKKNKNVAKSIMNTAKSIGGLITAISGAVIALNKLSESLVQQNQYWLNLTRNSDIALETFQKWGQVGAAMNASLGEQGAAGALAELNKRLFEMKLTGEGYEGFAFAGIMPTNAEDVLEQLRGRIKGLNDTAATAMLERLGLDPRMLSVLRMTREEFEALNAEMEKYRLTPEQRQQIQDFHKQMSIINVKMQYFKDRILVAIMPHLIRFMEVIVKIIEVLPKYRGLVIGVGLAMTKGFGKWLKALPIIGKYLMPVVKILQKMRIFSSGLFKGLSGIINKLPFVGTLFGTLGKIISKAFLPFTIVYLLIDDIVGYFNGKNSGIGAIIHYLKDMGKDFLNIGKIFTTKPLLAFKYALIKIGDLFIKIAKIILTTIDWIFNTPFGKWLEKIYGGNEDYNAKMDDLSESLRQMAAEVEAERAGEQNLATNTLPSNVYNNGGNTNKTNNYAPTYNITIDTPEGQRIIQNFLRQQDLNQAATVFK